MASITIASGASSVTYSDGGISVQVNPAGAKSEKLTFPGADGYLVKVNGRTYQMLRVKFYASGSSGDGKTLNDALVTLGTILANMIGRSGDRIGATLADGTTNTYTHLLFNNDAQVGRMLYRNGKWVASVSFTCEVVGT